MNEITSRLLLACVVGVMWIAFAAMCLAQEGPRSQKQYHLALIQAEARMTQDADRMFTRTGRMDRQEVRYNAGPRPDGDRTAAKTVAGAGTF